MFNTDVCSEWALRDLVAEAGPEVVPELEPEATGAFWGRRYGCARVGFWACRLRGCLLGPLGPGTEETEVPL
jgi:hypothetical protein